jgi:DNA-binding LytR/AlgR family response regulator
MKAMDGISLAKRLRAEGQRMQILFVTGFASLIGEGYEVSALHFLVKPIEEEKLHEVLHKALSLIEQTEPYVVVDTAVGKARIFHRDILYVEAFAHSTNIQTTKGSYDAKLTIGELEKSLGNSFFRCHRSYLVGLRIIERVTRSDVILDNGKAIPLSRRLYESANMAFITFYRGNRL